MPWLLSSANLLTRSLMTANMSNLSLAGEDLGLDPDPDLLWDCDPDFLRDLDLRGLEVERLLDFDLDLLILD